MGVTGIMSEKNRVRGGIKENEEAENG